jgi:hypothetical protein
MTISFLRRALLHEVNQVTLSAVSVSEGFTDMPGFEGRPTLYFNVIEASITLKFM